MPDPHDFPTALQASAVPRWSHRDPVEGGNPFSADDARHGVWDEATAKAVRALVRYDAELETAESSHTTATDYPIRLVGLAIARFDTWAERCLCVVVNDAAVSAYEAWLSDYVQNWLVYVSATCPHVDVGRELRRRLTERAGSWTTAAFRQIAARASS